MNIRILLSDASKRLSTEEASLEAQLLLQNVLNVNRAWLIAHADDELNAADKAKFDALIARRIADEPIAYILGYREFYGLTLNVTPHTLIPRPDTETLVEAALQKIEVDLPLSICDLGTGTGAIALAIAKHRPLAHVTAVDFSEGALAVAQENAQQLNIPNVTFLKSDWLSQLNQQRFDLVVSNPPYIEEADAHLMQGDLRFEPLSALASGKDGLDAIRHIIAQAPMHLQPNGWLMLEHGYNQAALVAQLMRQAGFVDVTHAQDLSGIQRVTLGCLKPAIV